MKVGSFGPAESTRVVWLSGPRLASSAQLSTSFLPAYACRPPSEEPSFEHFQCEKMMPS